MRDKMEELKHDLKKIDKLKEELVDWTCAEFGNGKENLDTKEAGEVIDMIKDLAEAKSKCWEAMYYETVTKSMIDATEEDMMPEEFKRRGYSDNSSNRASNSKNYGRNMENYQMAKRNYTESHNKKDKDEMETYASSHLDETIETIKDIWKDADQDMKMRMKSDLAKLVNEMSV